jgi:hypothetical protein
MKLRDILGTGGLNLILVPKDRSNGDGKNGRYAGGAQRAEAAAASGSKSRHRDPAPLR